MLIGRDRELGELGAALAEVSSGSGGLFLISGEPGIGKTSLASRAALDARDRGVRVTWGRCWEAGGAPALWPWREAFEGRGLAFPDAITTADPEQARFGLFRAVVAALATAGPLLVVLEDLHAADRSTLLLLELLAGQLRALPLIVIGTYRELEATLRADGGDVLARLGRVGRVLPLARLRAAEVAALVRRELDGADERLAATVYETTGGNPLFVAELVRAARAGGRAAPIPLGVREAIRQRLDLVPEAARAALEVAAVLGVELRAADAERVLPGAAARLEQAARLDVVVASGTRLRFSHALYREALYHDLARDRRQALHDAAARALAAHDAPLAEIAHHLLEAGPAVAAEAIDHAIRAARLALEVFAFEDAAALLERARAVVPPDPAGRSLRARLLIAVGETRLRSGDPTGREICVEAADLARELGDAALLAEAALAYGAVLRTGGVDPVMVALLEEALAALPDADSSLRARVMARLGAARQPAVASRATDIQLAFDAIAMARRVARPRELLLVLHSACGVLYGSVAPPLRLTVARELERIAEEVGDMARLLHARTRIALDLLELADFASYQRLIGSYEQLVARLGPAAGAWRVPLMRSMVALCSDRFDESARWQEAAARIDPELAQARRARALHRIGFLRAAERHAEIRAGIPAVRSLWLEYPYGRVLADAHVASELARIGADDEVRALLAAMPDEVFAEEINSTALAEAIWLTGEATHAARVRDHLLAAGERWRVYWLDSELAEPPHDRLIAYLSAILGDWDEAERRFELALRAVEAVGRRALAARMRFELGDLMLRLGRDPARARALVAEGRAQAAAIGLPELVALIDRRHPAPSSARPGAFAMALEGEYYAVTTARGVVRIRAVRGMSYLAALVARPGVEVHVLELVGADEADRGDAGELVDAAALRAYKARLAALRDALDDAEELGDADRAERARSEMEAIAAELSRSTGKRGQPRRSASAVERARSAVQRRIKDAIDRIAEQDAALGQWLRRAVTTGTHCSFQPPP